MCASAQPSEIALPLVYCLSWCYHTPMLHSACRSRNLSYSCRFFSPIVRPRRCCWATPQVRLVTMAIRHASEFSKSSYPSRSTGPSVVKSRNYASLQSRDSIPPIAIPTEMSSHVSRRGLDSLIGLLLASWVTVKPITPTRYRDDLWCQLSCGCRSKSGLPLCCPALL